MNTNTIQLIEKLADKLGTTTEMLWGVLIKQAAISAWAWIVVDVTLITITLALIKPTKRVYEKDNSWDAHVYWWVYAMIAVVVFIIVACTLPDIISQLFNPEYWALTKILEQI